MGSILTRKPIPGYLMHSATKGFSTWFGRGLSFELEGLGIDVLTYEPGFLKTNHFQSTFFRRNLFGIKAMDSANAALTELEL
jgi:short-subunit dehydrogenase